MRQTLFLVIFWVVAVGALPVGAEQDMGDAGTGSAPTDTRVVVPPEEPFDGEAAEEVQVEPLKGQLLHDYRDERMIKAEQDAQADIAATLAEIDSLDNRGDEPALQREIERIKQDVEMSRLRIMMADAERQGDQDRADKLWAEIEHLSAIEEPVVGIPQKQPAR